MNSPAARTSHFRIYKVLYLTGFADSLFQSRPLLRDTETFVEKPVTGQALLEAVSMALFLGKRADLD